MTTTADTLSELLQSCASITKSALSLKTLVKFEDVDAAIDQEQEIAKWLDRQRLDYSSTGESSAADTKQSDLLEATWNQHLYHFLLERIQMSSSAHAALACGDLSVLVQEGLTSRDSQADQVTRLQNEVMEVQEELEAVTQQCRSCQQENRKLWNEMQSMQEESMSSSRDEKLVEQSLVQKRVLADLIVGTDYLYTNERIAEILLKLED